LRHRELRSSVGTASGKELSNRTPAFRFCIASLQAAPHAACDSMNAQAHDRVWNDDIHGSRRFSRDRTRRVGQSRGDRPRSLQGPADLGQHAPSSPDSGRGDQAAHRLCFIGAGAGVRLASAAQRRPRRVERRAHAQRHAVVSCPPRPVSSTLHRGVAGHRPGLAAND
jgi:hypothetical protein